MIRLERLEDFRREVVRAAGHLLVAWHSPTLLPIGISLVQTRPDGRLSLLKNPAPGPVSLWDEMAVELGGLAIEQLVFGWNENSFIDLTKAVAKADELRVLNCHGDSPWTDRPLTEELPADRISVPSNKDDETLTVGWRRAVGILLAHQRELELLCIHLSVCSEADLLETWRILGRRPIVFPLFNLVVDVGRAIRARRNR